MKSMISLRLGQWMLGLAFILLSACASGVEAPAALPTPDTSTPVQPVLTLEEYGVRFRYPSEYQAVIFREGMCLSPAREYGPPGPCHVQNFGLEVLQAGGRSLEQAAEEAAARGNPDIEVRRTPITVGGRPAVLLDDIYAADILRMVVVVHNDRIYRLTFVPWAENQAAGSPVSKIYTTVIDSFEFLEAGQPVPESSSDPIFLSAETFASTSPDGVWTAEAVVLQFAEKDYARLKLYRQVDNAIQALIPYEEWSGTGLGDSYLSELIWSPDGRYLYFTHRGHADGCGTPFVTHLRRVDLHSGALDEIPLTGIGLEVITLSPQADRLAYRTADGFLIRSLETGEEGTIPYDWPEGGDFLVSSYAWSPDGKKLAFTLTQGYCFSVPGEASGTSIRLIDLETGLEQVLTDRDARLLVVTGWPEPGRLQVLQDGRLHLLDIASGALTPAP